MGTAPSLLSALLFALLVCLALTASDGAGRVVRGVPGAGYLERSSPICISPPRCRHVVTHLSGQAMEPVPASVPASTPTITYRSILGASEDLAASMPVSLPAPTLRPRDQTSLLETISSLRKELESATASAESRSRELVSSLDGLRTSSAALAASASSALLFVQASASSAVAAANASAASAVSAASQSPANGTQPQTQDDKMGKQISVPIFVVSIVISVFGSAMISMVALYVFMCRRRTRQRGTEHEEVANAALDRAIVSYIAKENSGPPEEIQTDPQSSTRPLGRSATTATDATMTAAGTEAASDALWSNQDSLAVNVERKQSLHRTDTTITDSTATDSLRKTASSIYMDSAERVYGDILVRPLERSSLAVASPGLRFVPSVRGDDIGWPLAKETWL